MKTIITSLFVLNRREPIAFYYNLVFPLIGFLIYLYFRADRQQEFASSQDVFFQFCAYTILTGSVYGVGIAFLQWRESGFFLTFCKGTRSLRRLLTSQLFLRSLFGVFFIACFGIAALWYFHDWQWPFFLRLVLAAFGLCLLMGWLSHALLLFRIYPSDLGALINAGVFICLMLNAFEIHGSSSSQVLGMLNFLNPLAFITKVLLVVEGMALMPFERLVLMAQTAMFLILGSLGFHHLHKHPVVQRL
jgi:hypothetical protein